MKIIFKILNKISTKMRILFGCFMRKKVPMSFEEASLYLNEKYKNFKSSCINTSVKINGGGSPYILSIIIPVYNVEAYIEKCIESIISQESKYKYEVIIINDGSTDNSGKILSKFETYNNIKVIHQENTGVAGARNAGIDQATGQYLMFVDFDDFIMPNSINLLMDRALEYNADIVEGGFLSLFPNGKKKENPCSNKIEIVNQPLGVLEGYFCGKVYKSYLFDTIRFPYGYWYEDSLNSNIILCKSIKSVLIPELVYCYYQNPKSITHVSMKYYKSIDSLYITESLIKDHIVLGLEINQDYYEYFLRMVKLTFNRTKELDEQTRYAIFIYQRYLYETYFNSFNTKVDSMRKIENSIINNNYKKYIMTLV